MRHAEAEPAPAGGGDAERALTARGQAQAAAAAAGLRDLDGRPDRILASPLRRAQETAAILARALGRPPIATVSVLDGAAPPEAILAALGRIGAEERVALVGHMPVLAELVALATAGPAPGLATASVALLEFLERPARGAGRLCWVRSPEQFGPLAKG